MCSTLLIKDDYRNFTVEYTAWALPYIKRVDKNMK
jgi:hypothetical protein